MLLFIPFLHKITVDKLGITREKLIQILISAILSAGIAFLQTALSHWTASPTLDTNIPVATGVGGIIHYLRTRNNV